MEKSKETLKEFLENIAEEQDYENCQIKMKEFSSDGANYTSFLCFAALQSSGKEDLKLFAKVATVGENMRSLGPIFSVENYFYNNLLIKYRQLEDKNNVPAEHRLVTPKFYGGSEEYLNEILILEDLSAKGYTTHDRFKPTDWEYVSKSLENLAKFHALSIAFAKDDPEGFQNSSILNRKIDYSGLQNFITTSIEAAIRATREENRDRVAKYFLELHVHKVDTDFFNKPHRRPVIMHGDYRPSNLMHRIIDGKMDVVSVDYQMIRVGNPIPDITYLIFVGSDKKFRDQHFKQSLEHYYRELCKALRRLGLDPEEVYSRDDYDYELRELLPVGIFQSICSLLIVTVDKEKAPEVNDDFRFDDFAVNPNQLYTERINEVFDDYINMGIIK